MKAPIIPAKYFGSINVRGIQASTFLQGQLTCDLREITHTQGAFGACCEQKGRIISNFFIFQEETSYHLLLPKSMIDGTLSHLKKYAVFSKVELITGSDEASKKYQGTQITLKALNENDWRLKNIQIGFAWIYSETTTLFIPQMISLQKWGGVSFSKGCYLGQEIIARSEYLGQLKRRLYRATVTQNNSPSIGDELKNAEGQGIGIIVESAQVSDKEHQLLAVIQDQGLKNKILVNQSAELTHIEPAEPAADPSLRIGLP